MKLKSLTIFLFFFIPVWAAAQINKEMLFSIWNDPSQSDSSRLNAVDEIAWTIYLRTKPDSSFWYANRQYELAEKIGSRIDMGRAKQTQGASLYARGLFSEAVICFLEAISIREEIGDSKGLSSSLNNIGLVYTMMFEYDKAIDCYNKCMTIYEQSGDSLKMGTLFGNIGIIHYNNGEYAKALHYYLKSIELKEKANDRKGLATTYNNIGSIYFYQGEYEKAKLYYTRSLEKSKESEDFTGVGNALSNIGGVMRIEKDFAGALDKQNEALNIRKEMSDNLGISKSYGNIGIIYQYMGDYKTSHEYYQQSLAISEELGNHEDVSASLSDLAWLMSTQNKYPQSISYASKSLKIADEFNISRKMKTALDVLFPSYLKTGKIDSAFYFLSRLHKLADNQIDINYFTLPEHEKELFFATLQSDYGFYYEFTVNHWKEYPAAPDTAYNIAIQTKGLSMKSSTAIRHTILESEDSSLIREYEDWLALKMKISKLGTSDSTMKQMCENADAVEAELVKKSIPFSDFNTLKKLDWKSVQARLKPGEAAIEFVHYSSAIDTIGTIYYAALIVKYNSVHPDVVLLCSEPELMTLLSGFKGNNSEMIHQVYGTSSDSTAEIYKKIWQPLEPYLNGVKGIYYSPSGLLNKVSFAALKQDRKVFLCDKYNLSHQIGTGSLVINDDSPRDENESFLVVGGVQYNTQKTNKQIWTYLDGTEKEASQIQEILSSHRKKVELLNGEIATEENLKIGATEATVLHIASHGFFFPDPKEVVFNSETTSNIDENTTFRGNTNYANWSFVLNSNPLMRSGIVLAGANAVWDREVAETGEDGILTALEVSNLNLSKTKLVVLSACETGLGDIKGSEGVYGLQRAFKMAGAKYIIMSLWQVPDKETVEFMTTFYKNLTKLRDIRKAFSVTQKAMREKYDPYYWAAFVLVE